MWDVVLYTLLQLNPSIVHFLLHMMAQITPLEVFAKSTIDLKSDIIIFYFGYNGYLNERITTTYN